MKRTYLLIATLLAAPPPTERTCSHPRKYNLLCHKLRGHRTKSHQISTRCTEMIADYSAKIKIAIFRSVSERQRMKIVVKMRANRGKNCTFQ